MCHIFNYLSGIYLVWAPGDSNPEPTDYESGALTVELGAPFQKAGKVISFSPFIQEKIMSMFC